MPYREPLPENCPPETAEEITEPRIVYRLVRNNPPTDADFRSQRAANPQRHFRIPECQVRGLSVFSDYQVAVSWSRSRSLRGTQVCRVTLNRSAGRIQKTGSAAHYTWWPLAAYDIPAHCQVAS